MKCLPKKSKCIDLNVYTTCRKVWVKVLSPVLCVNSSWKESCSVHFSTFTGREQTDWEVHPLPLSPAPKCLCGTIRERKIFPFPLPAQILWKCLVLTRALFFVHCRPEHLPKRDKHCLWELSRSGHSDCRTTWGFPIKLYMLHGSQVEKALSAHKELLSTLYWRIAYRWRMNCKISSWRKQFMGFPIFESVMGVQSTQLLNSLIKQQRDCLGQGQTSFSHWRKHRNGSR